MFKGFSIGGGSAPQQTDDQKEAQAALDEYDALPNDPDRALEWLCRVAVFLLKRVVKG